jgi:hypothetical protein
VFPANLGQDIISDFAPGQDALEFRDGILADAAAALTATVSGNSTIITIDANVRSRSSPCAAIRPD